VAKLSERLNRQDTEEEKALMIKVPAAMVNIFENVKDQSLTQAAFTNIRIKTGDTQMTTLRTINLTLVDNNPNLKAKDKIVFQTLNFITEHNDERTIQQVLMSGDVATALDKHNKKRLETVDKEILRNTGRDVMLEEVEIFNLQWQVVRVA
jgi:hypothetical protein